MSLEKGLRRLVALRKAKRLYVLGSQAMDAHSTVTGAIEDVRETVEESCNVFKGELEADRRDSSILAFLEEYIGKE